MFGSQAIFLTVAAAAMTAGGNVLIRAGIDRAGGFAPASLWDVPGSFFVLLRSPMFFVGFVLYFAAAIVWFRVIAIAPLGVAYPVLVSLTFLLVAAAAVLLFNEPFTARKGIGLATIVVGIALVSYDWPS